MTNYSREYSHNKQIGIWLLICCVLIFCMVVLGGVTRLTGSGLSMVDWQPLMGIVPPLSEREWQASFEQYQQYPEYQQINRHMELAEYKTIFAFEYSHRVLGRLIGVVFLLPFLYFLFRGIIHRKQTPKFIAMFILGGLQGLLGWYMVKSGLVNDPHVSQYRLAAHLTAAIVIYGYILWNALQYLDPMTENAHVTGIGPLRRHALGVTGLIFLMIISGAFVAGTHAGFVFNTFPLMYDNFIPPGLFALQPFYRNFFENLATVQFNHRLIAYLLILSILALWLLSRRHHFTRRTRLYFNLLLAMLVIQVALGISTLLLVVPVPLAAAHQACALLLFSLALLVNHKLRGSPRENL